MNRTFNRKHFNIHMIFINFPKLRFRGCLQHCFKMEERFDEFSNKPIIKNFRLSLFGTIPCFAHGAQISSPPPYF